MRRAILSLDPSPHPGWIGASFFFLFFLFRVSEEEFRQAGGEKEAAATSTWPMHRQAWSASRRVLAHTTWPWTGRPGFKSPRDAGGAARATVHACDMSTQVPRPPSVHDGAGGGGGGGDAGAAAGGGAAGEKDSQGVKATTGNGVAGAAAHPTSHHHRIERRASIDIGSGATKLMVADVDLTTNRVVRTLFGEERTVSFSLKGRDADGSLTDDIMTKGLGVLQDYRAKVDELMAMEGPQPSGPATGSPSGDGGGGGGGAPRVAAVATEVFRKAPNGLDFLHRVCALR